MIHQYDIEIEHMKNMQKVLNDKISTLEAEVVNYQVEIKDKNCEIREGKLMIQKKVKEFER